MDTDDADSIGPLHSMGVVCRRTGLKSDRVRAWERRYGVVEPVRSGGNHRLYREADVEKLLLLRQATEAGHRIAQIADLSVSDLRHLLDRDRGAVSGGRGPSPRAAEEAGARVRSCLGAVQQLDAESLRLQLQQARASLPPSAITEGILVPLIREIGDLWAEGGLKAAHEHLGTAVLRTFLEELRTSSDLPHDAPRMLMTTPAGEVHELGALLATAMATDAGWSVTYLGPDLPAPEIAGAARQTGARAIGLSVVCPGDEATVRAELATLRRHVGASTGLIIGGRAAAAFADTASEIGAVIVSDLAGLRSALAPFA